MSFKLFEPPATAWIKPIEEGQAGLAKSGTLTLRPEDLALVQIEGKVRVLVDTGTLRIAFRQTDDDDMHSIRVATAGKGGNRRKINIAAVLKRLSLDPREAAGRYRLATKDNLLILDLANGCIG